MSTKLIIVIVSVFWILVGIYNTVSGLMLTSAYIATPPLKSPLWSLIFQVGTGVFTLIAASSVLAGIQLLRGRSWARLLLLIYSIIIALIPVAGFTYWLSGNYNYGPQPIFGAVIWMSGTLVLPVAMIMILQSQTIKNEMKGRTRRLRVPLPADGSRSPHR